MRNSALVNLTSLGSLPSRLAARFACKLMLMLAVAVLAGCPESDSTADAGRPDSGMKSDAGSDEDAGADDGGGVAAKLERPPILPRPPQNGLPADLRPPR